MRLLPEQHTQHEVVITYKPKKTVGNGLDPMAAWHIKVDDKFIGTSPTLNGVTHLLYDKGYKTWAFRRCPQKNGRPRFKATVIKVNE